MNNAINFFEIAASNFDRAVEFYQKLLGTEVVTDEVQGIKMAFFPSDERTVAGAICCGDGYKPSSDGVLLYLNGGDDLNPILENVQALGGKNILPKTLISEEIGSIALFLDSEGNKVGISFSN